MPINSSSIQTDFVVDTTITTTCEAAINSSADDLFNLIDINKFNDYFKKIYPNSNEDPTQIWHSLLGNHPSGYEIGINKQVSFLTEESCIEILKYYPLFNNGIDLNYLPSGFFLTKNPSNGMRDVLHYSDFLAKNKPQKSPLAIILSKKETTNEQHEFLPPQSTWYEFLRSKLQSENTTFCTEQELKAAFIFFSNTVERLKLKFSLVDFSKNKEECNPIVLLARWNTVLTQPSLKACDYEEQFKVLHLLPLNHGYEAIRAINDYQHTANPCGFLIPEMFPWSTKYNEKNINDFINIYDSNTEFDAFMHVNSENIAYLWRFLAFEPQRNSISYYRKGLTYLEQIVCYDKEKIQLQKTLVKSSTGITHLANTASDENKELEYWNLICNFFAKDWLNYKIRMLTFGLLSVKKISDDDKKKGMEIIMANLKDRPIPPVPLLYSAIMCLKDISYEIGSLLTGIKTKKMNIYKELHDLARKYGKNFYMGAKFYLKDESVSTFNLERYVSLQKHIDEYKNHIHYTKTLLISILSNFNIETIKDVAQLLEISSNLNNDFLHFSLELFQDAIAPGNKNDFIKIVDIIRKNSDETHAYIQILSDMQPYFTQYFPQNYFEDKKLNIIHKDTNLNPELSKRIQNLFAQEQHKVLQQIICSLQSNYHNINKLNDIIDVFFDLSRFISHDDFKKLLECLNSCNALLINVQSLIELLNKIKEQQNITSFSQIYFRNSINKCADKLLTNKFIFFIDNIKHISKPLGPIPVSTAHELFANLILNANIDSINDNFLKDIVFSFGSIERVVIEYPHIQQYIIESLNNIHGKNTEKFINNILLFTYALTYISDILPGRNNDLSQENMLHVYDLLAKFHKRPEILVTILEKIKKLETNEQQRFVLLLANKLIKDHADKENIQGLINIIEKIVQESTSEDDLLQYFGIPSLNTYSRLLQYCSTPPFPSIHTIKAWLDNNDYETYEKFSITPYGTRQLSFAFKKEEFAIQKSLFKGIDVKLFNDEIATKLDNQLKENRTKAIRTLGDKFQILRSSNPLSDQEKLEMLCICIELLARTTSQLNPHVAANEISQELNTTQVMALYAMLTTNHAKLISEIETGEGKSRISMILAACQVCQNKTVDFITSDMPLAERDYLTYKAFFDSLNINTSLISLDTPKQLYQKNGINFSDNSQLLLLRNRSDILLNKFEYLDENVQNRCLIMDEIDKFMHDKSTDAYNFASASKKLKDFTWIYPLLVNFVQDKIESNPDTQFQAESLIDNFIHYVAIRDNDETHNAALESLNIKYKDQITIWLNSAHTALNMKVNIDYKVTEDEHNKLVRVQDGQGFTRYSRKVLVLDNGRTVEKSSYALGVHQCLCAIENKRTINDFIILPENQTQRSAFPINFMEHYNNGNIFGVSGTTRYEAPTTNAHINYNNFSYIVVPRHKKLLREDKNIWLAKDEVQQIKFIKESIREKLLQKPKRPVLLICKNDVQSNILYQALIADESLQTLINKCTYVHGLVEATDEIQAINEASLPGNITISTVGMFGRGVDIKADNLYVISAYVPTFEDEKQIKGRTARAGKPGEYRMIPNAADPECPINGNTYNVYNEIDKIQKNMALQATNQEELGRLFAYFSENIHQDFFRSFNGTPNLNQIGLLEQWQNYLNNLQKDWSVKRIQLLHHLENAKEQDFISDFNNFTQHWEKSTPFYNEATHLPFSSEKAALIFTSIKNHKEFFKPERQPIKVQDNYDVADDGQARIYTTLFAKERAALRGERSWFADINAWREGRGSAFPNLMATLRGERPIFADLRATIARLLKELREWISKLFSSTNTPAEANDISNVTMDVNTPTYNTRPVLT